MERRLLSGVIRNFKVSVESNIQMLGVDEKLTNLKYQPTCPPDLS